MEVWIACGFFWKVSECDLLLSPLFVGVKAVIWRVPWKFHDDNFSFMFPKFFILFHCVFNPIICFTADLELAFFKNNKKFGVKIEA